jgi:signal transduction histidine kinase
MINRLLLPRNPLSNKKIPGSKSSWSRHPGFSITVAVFLFSILAVLAVLQYRWSGQLSKAEYERMQSSLLVSMNQFRLHFNNELRQTGISLRPETAVLMRNDWQAYAENCMALLSMPDFQGVQNIFLWISEIRDGSRLLGLNRERKTYEPVSWPSELAGIKKQYENMFHNISQLPRPLRPFIAVAPNQSVFLVQPLAFPGPPSRPDAAEAKFKGILIMELNSEIVLGELLPRLAQEYFSSRDGFIYHVAVVDRNNPEDLIFQSEPTLTSADFTQPDARLGLIDIPREPPEPGGPYPGGEERPGPGSELFPGRFRPLPPESMRNVEPGPADREESLWDLLAIHRKGSLEAVVAATRYRNLAISFGSLLLLAASVTLILVSARRAHRLTQLQIDFVAGVSHELRTPLAVICSAGDNLAEGVVAGSGMAIHNYGKLIRSEGRKLTAMVEQIMQFSGLQSGRRRHSLRPARINEVVEAALEQAQPMLEAAGFSVETVLAPDLPPVNIDPSAMNQILQNLIQNAIKYSGEVRWLGIRTAGLQTKQGIDMELTVEDKGIGIGSKDLPYVFDPFYRGNAAIERQIHGTGLGLFLVRGILDSMGGTVRVESTAGQGSIFTIRLPALPVSSNNKGHTDHVV